MKLWVIGNQTAVWGFALTGVGGQIVTTVEALHNAVQTALDNAEVGIVLVTADVASLDRAWMDGVMARSDRPLVVEIPGPRGSDPDSPSLGEVIRQTIGVKI